MIRMGSVVAIGVFAAVLSGPGAAAPQGSSNATGTSPATTIVLPQKLVAGQRATLAVLDATGRLAPRVVVEFTGGERVSTDATGRAGFTAPAEAGVLRAQLPGVEMSASTTVIAPPPNPSDGVQVFDYPHVISVSDRFAVDGSGFRGDADGNHAMLGGQPALVLAASPVALVLLPGPRVPEGTAQLLIEAGGRRAGAVQVTLVSIELSVVRNQLAPGEKGKLTVRLHGTGQRLVIEVRNLTPEIIALPQGNLQRVTSTGGFANSAQVELQGVRAGDFSISAKLVPGVTGLPDVEAARQYLMAARGLVTGEVQDRVDRIIRRIQRDPQDIKHIRADLEKMLAKRPVGEFGRLLEAAWRELLMR